MITLSFSQAAAAMGADLKNDTEGASFCGVSTDSRKIEPGMLYVPIVGARADGHDFARSAIENGASGMLWMKDHLPYPEDFPILIVDEPVEALGRLAHARLQSMNCITAGITGSNGKTSAKDLLAGVLSQKYKTYKTQGNHNNEIGLPLTVFEADDDVQALVLEMGMENAGEISYLCKIAPLDLAIITSIGSAHMENLGSIENIAKAKAEILEGLSEEGTLIWNAASSELREVLKPLLAKKPCKAIAYGPGTEYEPEDLHFSRKGLTFRLNNIDDKPFAVKAAASVQADNATAAVLAGLQLGISKEQCHAGIEAAELTPMRGQILEWNQAMILDDTYKSNPEAAKSSLKTLMQLPAEVHVAVLGDMLDLGPEEAKFHEEIGTLAKELGVDFLYTFGDRSVHTANGFGKGAYHYEDKQALAGDLMQYADQNAAILIKGSRAMAMDTIIKSLQAGGQGRN